MTVQETDVSLWALCWLLYA